MSVDTSLYKKVMGQFVTGVTVISTRKQDVSYGITVNSFNSLSLKPPLICYCLGKGASSYDDFITADSFAVNILSAHQQSVSDQFAFKDKSDWSEIPHHLGMNGAPIIEGTSATIECSTHHIYEGGDHNIIVGLVTNLSQNDTLPLAYYRGGYFDTATMKEV
ncbi:MAG: flavin reductase family protein [Rickettsiales bacterium]|nr:flavin reductase family protein [Rickettsiales bacterium]